MFIFLMENKTNLQNKISQGVLAEKVAFLKCLKDLNSKH